jgi:outer membrane lipoprotein SlyB
MKTISITLTFIVSLIWVLGGCQTSQGSKTYSTSQAQTAHSVYYGTVLKVAQVTLQKPQSGAGAIGGAVVGGVIGSTIGQGRGRRLATTAGALGGAAMGSAAESSAGQKNGLEIEVELDDGRILVVVQEKDDEFAVGDRVRLVQGRDGTSRIRQ